MELVETNRPLRIALIGLGAVGQAVCRLVQTHAADEVVMVGALVRDPGRARHADLPPVLAGVDDLLALRPEVVVEAGGHAALRTHGPAVLRAGCDLILVSVGALADPDLEAELRAAARASGSRIRVPAGAVGALDAIAAAAWGGLERVTHTTIKPARTLMPPEEAAQLAEPTVVYRGSAREAARKYPESVNVMAAVSLAGIGMDRTEVRVVADPHGTRNRHEVAAEGFFGSLRVEIQGIPSDENPRTSRLTALSAFHALRTRRALLAIG